ncbi:valencene synthase-like [Vitis riparia]|uniref:valencene synthase-like n=1 Tax=Vitis riparia TaxID=96939 RepID=UPI00155AABE7|nr:valencene synthase-like [Vitis riparia]
MLVALVTSSSCMLTTWSFIGMGEIMTKEAFDWVFSDPKILTAAAVILRLMDDITTHEFEQKRGHVASGIECYMKQHGVSEEQVYSQFYKQVENAWLDINQECLKPTAVPMPPLTRVVNLS